MFHHAKNRIFSNSRASYSTSAIFSDAGAAGFVAGAWSSSSIPSLKGLPEVNIPLQPSFKFDLRLESKVIVTG